MIDSQRILLGILISSAIGAIAYRRGSLSRSGWLGAIITGTIIFGAGGWAHGITLVFFFVSSTLLSRWRTAYKATLERQVFEKGSQRDIWQALANAGVAATSCVLLVVVPADALIWHMLFAGAMATVAADTWATELGVLAKTPPRLITTWHAVPRGTSGAISVAGTLATAAGALATSAVFWGCLTVFTDTPLSTSLGLAVAVAGGAGIIGSLSDSLLGATVQRSFTTPNGPSERAHAPDGTPYPLRSGWMWVNNDVVNAVSSACGALVGAGCWWLLFR